MTTTVLYSCTKCKLHRVPVIVPAREQEDVIAWMKTTTNFLSLDHAKRSPYCDTTELQEVMIPMTGRDKVGGPVLQ